jgi:hypothetical protein
MFLLIISLFFLNCGSTYYALKDGDFPETQKKSEKVNWLAVGSDVFFGVTMPVIIGNPAGMVSAVIYITVDYITGCMYLKTEKK